MFGQSLLSAFGSAVACTTDTDQLFTTDVQTTSVATYQLNNAATSIPNNTYPGTANNITYAAGQFGQAAVFNGSSGYIQNSSLIRGAEYSISVWIKTDTASGERMAIGWNWSGSQRFAIGIKDGGIKYQNGNSGWLTILSSVSTNTWYNVIITSGSNQYNAYLNGNKIAAASGTGSTPASTVGYGLNLGRFGSNAGYWDGSIDQVRIFDTALPQSAVTALYNETTTTAQSASVDYVVPNPNSVAYYKMSDATDQLGNYNGTPTNVNFNTEGKFGFAGAFNGSSSYILLNGMTTAGFAPTAYSISAWFKTTSNNEAIFSTDGGGSSLPLTTMTRIFVNSGGYIQYDPYNVSSRITSTVTVNDGNWHFVCVSTDSSGNTKLYVDDQSPITGTGGGINFRSQTWIGCTDNAVYSTIVRSNFFNGSIDQVRIYDSALSAANVTTLYNEIECPAVAVTNAFNTVLYTGNGSTQPISTVGFKPDFTWIKNRNSTQSHRLYDSVRGANLQISSNQTAGENNSGGLTSFDSNGFSLNSWASVNTNNSTYVAWNWKAGGTAVSNTDGDNNSAMVSANPDAGFSIITYTGTGTNNSSVGHGLNQAPEMFIYKRTSSSGSWGIVHKDVNNYKAYLSFTTGGSTNNTSMNAPTDSVIRFNTTSPTYNGSGQDWLIYAFHSVDGYQRVGSYVGTGQPNNDVFTGFRPRWVMIKNTAGQGWNIVDSVRNPSNPANLNIQANDSAAESSTANPGVQVDFDDTGFSLVAPAGTPGQGQVNSNGATYIYLAIA